MTEYSNNLEVEDKLILNIMMFKDYGTYEHSMKVGKICEFLISKQKMFKDKETSKLVIRGAYLHDIGKILNNLSIQMLPRRLSEEEFYLIKNHPIMGYVIAKNLFPKIMVDIIKYHHYNPNMPDKSYPDLDKDDEFHDYIQFVSIIDKFEAMTETRPYKGPENLYNILSFIDCACNGFYGLDLLKNYCSDCYKIGLEQL